VPLSSFQIKAPAFLAMTMMMFLLSLKLKSAVQKLGYILIFHFLKKLFYLLLKLFYIIRKLLLRALI
jgi:hypothetical protein